MHTSRKILKFLFMLCGTVVATSLFGQTTYTWTGLSNGTSLDTPGNFTTNGVDPAVTLPNGFDLSGLQESVIWDGRTTTNLNLTRNSSADWPNVGLGAIGVNLLTTVNQTNDVQLATAPGVTLSGPIGFFAITNNSPHSSLILGTNWDNSVGNAFRLIGRPAGAVHPFVNNSTAPVIFNGSVEWEAGGGSPYTLDFMGPGDFIANSSLQCDNSLGGVSLQVDGPGTLVWTKVGYEVDGGPSFGTPPNGIGLVNIGSKLIVKSAGNFTPDRVPSTITISNGASLVFDAPSKSDTIDRVITGAGMLVMSNGTFTLSGTNAYSGNTTINAGKLVFQGAKTGAGGITVADNATLGVYDTGTPAMPSTLTLGNSAGCTLEFNNVTNTSSAIISAGTLSSTGTLTININSGLFAPGQVYPLLTWTTGPTPTFSPGVMNLNNSNFSGSLFINGKTVLLAVAGTTPTTYTWTGAVNATNIVPIGNWTPFGQPFSDTEDIAQWDGTTTSNLVLSFVSPGWPIDPYPPERGIQLVLTTNQTNSVQIISPSSLSTPIYLHNVTNSSPSAALILGDGSANDLEVIVRPNNVIHNFVNNSTTACIINPNVDWLGGGGEGYTYDFSGTGNWTVNNYLMPGNFSLSSTVQVDGPGTVFWSAGAAGSYVPNSALGNLVIHGGALILKSAFPGNNDQLRKTAISISTTLIYDPVNPDSQKLNGVISGSGQLIVNAGTLTLGGSNTYAGGTVISNGVLQIGTNGASGTLGVGNITNNSSLVFNRAGTLSVIGNLSGSGSVTVVGSGAVVLSGNNTYSGSTTISNGTLAANSITGVVNVNGGALAQSIDGTIGTVTVGGNLNLNSGAVVAAVNESFSPSNTVYQVSGAISYNGGVLKLLNFGPTLKPGDKFKIFNQAVTGGNSVTIVSPGFTVNNALATDGSVMVTGVQSADSNKMTASLSGGQLSLSWPSAWVGLHLQVQTNSLAQGLGSNWINIPGTDAGSNYITGLVQSNACVFYRLAP